MVQRFQSSAGSILAPLGDYVLHSDHLKLREALREALNGYEALSTGLEISGPPIRERIAELRKEFDL